MTISGEGGTVPRMVEPHPRLQAGECIKFRPRPHARPRDGVVISSDAGNAHIRDEDRRNRVIPTNRILVKVVGPKGGITWEQLDGAE